MKKLWSISTTGHLKRGKVGMFPLQHVLSDFLLSMTSSLSSDQTRTGVLHKKSRNNKLSYNSKENPKLGQPQVR